MYKNLKLRLKLLLSFSVVIFFLLAITGIAIVQINRINKSGSRVYEENVKPLATLEKVKSEFNELRRTATIVAVRALTGPESSVNSAIKDMENQYLILREAGNNHLKLLTEIEDTPNHYDMVNNMLKQIYNDYWPILEDISSLALADDVEKVLMSVDKAVTMAGNITREINTLFSEEMAISSTNTGQITSIAETSMMYLFISSAIAIIISIIFSLYIGEYISNQINMLRKATKEIAKGNLDIKLEQGSKDEIGELSRNLIEVVESLATVTEGLGKMTKDFKSGSINVKIDVSNFDGVYKTLAEEINDIFAININETLSFLDCVTDLANGNFDANLPKLPGEKIQMNNTLENVRNKIRSVSKEINRLVRSATKGELNNRADIEQYSGGWAEIMSELNQLMQAVSTPINDVQNVLAQVANGNFDQKISGDYQGAFLLIKSSVNNMIENINSYISEISNILSAVSHDDLNQSITREYIGEFSEMKIAINSIINKFNSVIAEMASASKQVADGARQISESSTILAQGATEQASSVQELNATMQLITQNTVQNAENTKVAKELSESSKINASKGDNDMKKMLLSMEEIKEFSSRISIIIKVINDIAQQTNLLALNAAVEAARAGSNGKGFTVVAEEVRNLAARSKNAATETAQLIEESINKVNEGTKIADITAHTLQSIIEDVSKVAVIVSSISTASEEQASAISQVMFGLSQITDVAQNNSATSEEAAAASQELSVQSETLENLVNIFKLKGDLKNNKFK